MALAWQNMPSACAHATEEVAVVVVELWIWVGVRRFRLEVDADGHLVRRGIRTRSVDLMRLRDVFVALQTEAGNREIPTR